MYIRAFLSIAAVLGCVTTVSASTEEKKFGDWVASCKIDRMTDKKECVIRGGAEDKRRKPYGIYNISISDDVKMVAIVGGMVIDIGRVRIDKNKVHECIGQLCIFNTESSETIISEMRNGNKVAVQIVSRYGNFDFDLDVNDYREAQGQVEAWKKQGD